MKAMLTYHNEINKCSLRMAPYVKRFEALKWRGRIRSHKVQKSSVGTASSSMNVQTTVMDTAHNRVQSVHDSEERSGDEEDEET